MKSLLKSTVAVVFLVLGSTAFSFADPLGSAPIVYGSNGASSGGGGGSGTVTSVSLSSPNNSACVVSGSPVTASGTLVCTPTGTSGGVPYFSGTNALGTSGALTANAPVLGGGAGAAPTVGSRSGSTTTFGTTTGTLTSGHLAAFDASGNIVDGGTAGTGTVTSVATGPGLTGGPITTTGTISPTLTLGNSGASITGTTYTVDLTTNITTSDLARQLRFTGSSALAMTLGSGSNGQAFDVVNRGTANITITATGNINGASTLVIQPGMWAAISSDGSTWTAENIPLASSTQFGAVKVDGTTITASGGVISSVGAGLPPQVFLNSKYYMAAPTGSTGTHQNQNIIYYTPIILPIGKTVSNIAGLVTAAQAGGNAQFQLYASDPTTNQPTGAPLCSSNISQSTASNGAIISAACGGVTTTTLMFLASNQDNNVASLWALSKGFPWTSWLIGAASTANIFNVAANVGTQWTSSSTFGTWPTNPTITEAKVSFDQTPNLAYQIN